MVNNQLVGGLELWNFIFHHIWDNHQPHWRTYIFQDGFLTTNQSRISRRGHFGALFSGAGLKHWDFPEGRCFYFWSGSLPSGKRLHSELENHNCSWVNQLFDWAMFKFANCKRLPGRVSSATPSPAVENGEHGWPVNHWFLKMCPFLNG